MAEQTADTPNRLDRRKARTRAALVRAAQAFIAAGKLNVPILKITQAADVGRGRSTTTSRTRSSSTRPRSRTPSTPTGPCSTS